MAQSRKNKNRKTQLNNFKTKRKQMNQQNLPQGMPEVRNIPTWSQDATITVTGYEWEAIQNGLAQIQLAQQAVQSVMSRNIVEGVIKMDFEKLDPKTLQYGPMDPEEKQKYEQEFNEMIAKFKQNVADKMQQASTGTAEAPVVQLLDETGEPVKDREVTVTPSQESADLTEAPKEEAKVVQMFPKTEG